MAVKTPQQSVIDHRRMLVARLRIRGFSQREIQVRLATPTESGQLATANPKGKPWSLGTINYDCQHLDKLWREEAFKAIEQHKAEINAELNELKRFGWQHDDPRTIADAIKQQRAMLGLDEPRKAEVSGPGGGPISIKEDRVIIVVHGDEDDGD